MARETIVVLIDDIDGGEAHETVEFSLDGVAYTIDLSEKNASQLRKLLQPYVDAASRVHRPHRVGQAATASNRELNREIRAWAREKGLKIADRGRIPDEIVEQYKKAQRSRR